MSHPSSHTTPGLTTAPLVTGSIVFAVLTFVGILLVFLAFSRGVIESKEVGFTLVFVVTAGLCLWMPWMSVWMVRFRS